MVCLLNLKNLKTEVQGQQGVGRRELVEVQGRAIRTLRTGGRGWLWGLTEPAAGSAGAGGSWGAGPCLLPH